VLASVIPNWNVWRKELSGKGQLHEADPRRQAAILEAQAEVERAKGAAEANKIIEDSLENNESYFRYVWIQGLHDGSSEVIYVPAES